MPAEGLDREVAGQKWHFPSRTECMVCHSRAANFVLGLSELQMNKPHDYGGVVDNQIRVLEHLGMLKVDYKAPAKADQRQATSTSLLTKPPAQYRSLPNPYGDSQPVDVRARSYLHVNCASCHIEAGGGNAQMNLEYTASLEKMKVIDMPPLHHQFGLDRARLIAPGHPERSVLLYRMAHRGEGSGQMPQLASNRADDQAVKLIEAWIRSLKVRDQHEP